MERRQALRTLGAAAAVPLLGRMSPAELVSFGRDARRRMQAGSWTAQTLNAHQEATVTVLAELIIPETETPGATSTNVNQFIDLILTEWYTDQERDGFLEGLANLDRRTQDAFSKNFLECDESEQIETLSTLDAEVTRLLETDSPNGNPAEEHFFYQMKRLTLTGYFTSKAGMKEALDFALIPGRYDGCVPYVQG